MSFTSVAMIALFAIVVLLIARAKLRQKDAEMAAMATMMGLQKQSPVALPSDVSLQAISQQPLPPELAKLMANGESEVREWSFGDKPEDMLKPGVHFSTNVRVKVFRKKI